MLSSLLYPPSRPDTERLRAAVGGKTVLLTGASFGIGEALAGKLAAAGAVRPSCNFCLLSIFRLFVFVRYRGEY
ncbi:hypothetical protein [Neisseria elongata]